MDKGDQILKAAQLAKEAHLGQYRKWGHSQDPYIWHPMRVAGLVMTIPATANMIIAAVLHDVIEDTKITEFDLISKGFGGEVIYFVKALTNTSKGMNGLPRHERKQMDRQHIASGPWEARTIKLADRLDNLLEMRNDPTTPQDFVRTYMGESRLLLDALKGTNSELELMIGRLI